MGKGKRKTILVLELVAMTLLLVGVGGAPVRAKETSSYGIAPGSEILWMSNEDLVRELDTYKSMGMAWLRVDLDWPSIESSKGVFNWSATDRVVTAAKARGLQVLAVPTYAPRWANNSSNDKVPPSDPSDYANFVSNAAVRYLDKINSWEIWNEPNGYQFWAPRPDPVAYTKLLISATTAIRAVSADATLITGGLEPAKDALDTPWSQISAETFLHSIYTNGGGEYFDAVGVHPYCYPALPSDEMSKTWNMFGRVPVVYSIMAAHGDGGKKVWLTEFGAATGGALDAVSEARQNAIIVDGISYAKTMAFVGPLMFYSGRDRGNDINNREDNFGFLKRDYTVKLSYTGIMTTVLHSVVNKPEIPSGVSSIGIILKKTKKSTRKVMIVRVNQGEVGRKINIIGRYQGSSKLRSMAWILVDRNGLGRKTINIRKNIRLRATCLSTVGLVVSRWVVVKI